MTFSMCLVRSASRCSMWADVGPDAAGHQLLVEVGQVHEGREVVAQPHRIDDREADLAGRHGRQQAQHGALHQRRPPGAARAAGLQQQQRTPRDRATPPAAGTRPARTQPLVFRHPAGIRGQLDLTVAEADRSAALPAGGFQRLQSSDAPIGKGLAGRPRESPRPTCGTAPDRSASARPCRPTRRSKRCRLSSTAAACRAPSCSDSRRYCSSIRRSRGGYFSSISWAVRSRQATRSANRWG